MKASVLDLQPWLDAIPKERRDRIAAADLAAEILRRRSGKYAERVADVFDVIRLAEWLLGIEGDA